MTPSSITATRSQMWRATAREWVITTSVTPSSLLIFASRFKTDTVVRVSSALVASSQSMMRGLFARARAIATRCCWPPESSLG